MRNCWQNNSLSKALAVILAQHYDTGNVRSFPYTEEERDMVTRADTGDSINMPYDILKGMLFVLHG